MGHIGIDVGGTKVLGVVCEPSSGEILSKTRQSTPKGRDDLADVILATVNTLVEDTEPAMSVGLGLPGLVDKRGVLRYGPNVPGVLSLDMVNQLEEAFGVPAVVHNDASCAAVAEHRLGAAVGHSDVVLVTQGTGIGGGLIVNGQLVLGANGFAGEPGHMLVNFGGEKCACGVKGCWEALASGTGLALLARQVIGEGRGHKILEYGGGQVAHVRGEHVSKALEDGDADAQEVLTRFKSWTSAGIASLINLLDPGIVVLGGGLSELAANFQADVELLVAELLMGSQYRPKTPIVPTTMGADSGAIGAAISGYDLYRARGCS